MTGDGTGEVAGRSADVGGTGAPRPAGRPAGDPGGRRAPAQVVLQLPRRLLALLVRGYQVGISPYTPPACRYDPVCSQYGMDALRVHGAVKGTILTSGRILRCNPLSHGGPDPVPAPGMWRNPPRLRHSAH